MALIGLVAACVAACGERQSAPASPASSVLAAAEAVLAAVDGRNAIGFARLSASASKDGLVDLTPEAVAEMLADLHERYGQRSRRLGPPQAVAGRARPTSEIAVTFAAGEPGLLLTFQQDGQARWRLVTLSDAAMDEPPEPGPQAPPAMKE